MPKRASILTAKEVKALTGTGFFAVGGVAGLSISINGRGGKSWVLRTTINGKRHDLGLGSYAEVSLAEARDQARRLRSDIRNGIDPMAAKRDQKLARKQETARSKSFREVAEAYFESGKLDQISNIKARQQWPSTLRTYAFPIIGDKRLSDLTPLDVKAVLDPIWTSKPETAKRVKDRIAKVIDWAIASGFCERPNVAEWKGNLDQLMPAVSRSAKKKMPAIKIEDVPEWFATLEKKTTTSALALRLLTLTATRSQEIRGAVWAEFDLRNNVWTIPASRMKANREHRIPLSKAAVDLIGTLAKFDGTDLVFPGKGNKEMSDMTLGKVMKQLDKEREQSGKGRFLDRVSGLPGVPHGLRSTFSDWAAETTNYPRDMVELSLAHSVGTAVEQAYRRGDMLEKRRNLMDDWAKHITSFKAPLQAS